MINQFLTITARDYTPKKVVGKNIKEENDINKLKRVEFRAPITEGFKNHLCLDPCDKKNYEEVDAYMNRALGIYPGLEFCTNGRPINKETIKRDNIFSKHTVYQTDYCDIEKKTVEKEYQRRNAITLYIPETTNKASFRLPISINSNAYVRAEPIRGKNNLDPDHKIRDILKVTTGLTEYSGVISKMGSRIMDEELHGHMPKQ